MTCLSFFSQVWYCLFHLLEVLYLIPQDINIVGFFLCVLIMSQVTIATTTPAMTVLGSGALPITMTVTLASYLSGSDNTGSE